MVLALLQVESNPEELTSPQVFPASANIKLRPGLHDDRESQHSCCSLSLSLSLSLSPLSLSLSLSHTPGVPGVFNITVAPAASFSVDMYMLMDLTLTMFQDLSSLKTFAAELGRSVCVDAMSE